ncbi:hypothetical protein ACWC9X_33300 [Streptomyces asoensis]
MAGTSETGTSGTEAGVPGDVGRLLREFTEAVGAVLAEGSRSRDVLVEALVGCHALASVPVYEDRLDPDPIETRVALSKAAHTLQLLVWHLRKRTGPVDPPAGETPPRRRRSASDQQRRKQREQERSREQEQAQERGAPPRQQQQRHEQQPAQDGGEGAAQTGAPAGGQEGPAGTTAGPRHAAPGPEAPGPEAPGQAPGAGTGPGAETDPDGPGDPRRTAAVRGGGISSAGRLTGTLAELHEELMSSQDTRGWLNAPVLALVPANPSPPKPPVTAAGHWLALHMALLRLPEDQRSEWHRKAAELARQDNGLAALSPLYDALDDPDVLVPALPGHHPGVRLSLTSESGRPLPSDMAHDIADAAALHRPDGGHERRRMWALRAHQALRLTELDPLLVFRWNNVTHSARTSTETSEYFRTQVTKQLAVLVSSVNNNWDGRNRFRAEHDLDGVIGSLLHSTPAAQDSWWWRWRAVPWPYMAEGAKAGDVEFSLRPEQLHRPQLFRWTAGSKNVGGHGGRSAPLLQWVLRAPAFDANERAGIGAVVIKPEATA